MRKRWIKILILRRKGKIVSDYNGYLYQIRSSDLHKPQSKKISSIPLSLNLLSDRRHLLVTVILRNYLYLWGKALYQRFPWTKSCRKILKLMKVLSKWPTARKFSCWTESWAAHLRTAQDFSRVFPFHILGQELRK